MNAWNISCQVPKQLAFAAAWIFLLVFSVTARQEEIISVKTELVNLNVVVVDRQGHPVSGLAKEDFEVYEDGKRQKITHFSAGERSRAARSALRYKHQHESCSASSQARGRRADRQVAPKR